MSEKQKQVVSLMSQGWQIQSMPMGKRYIIINNTPPFQIASLSPAIKAMIKSEIIIPTGQAKIKAGYQPTWKLKP